MASETMKRPISIILEDGQIALLDRRAKRKKISRSELIRQLIDEGVTCHTNNHRAVTGEEQS